MSLIEDAKTVLKDDVSVVYANDFGTRNEHAWEIDRDDWEAAKRVAQAFLDMHKEDDETKEPRGIPYDQYQGFDHLG